MKACVFCSANEGLDQRVYEEVRHFCKLLKEKNGELLYGGAKAGLMGYFADEALRCGVKKVRGAITEGLAKGHEMAHEGLQELVIVKDLFERKSWFLKESDVFFIFPGGFGTLDEALEMISWKGLGEASQPIFFMNIGGFWDSVLSAFDDLASKKVIRKGGLELYQVVASSREAFSQLESGK